MTGNKLTLVIHANGNMFLRKSRHKCLAGHHHRADRMGVEYINNGEATQGYSP